MKAIELCITNQEYEWLATQAKKSKMTVAQIIQSMVREAFIYQGEQLPEYDWDKEGIPQGKPVKNDPKQGLVIVEEGDS